VGLVGDGLRGEELRDLFLHPRRARVGALRGEQRRRLAHWMAEALVEFLDVVVGGAKIHNRWPFTVGRSPLAVGRGTINRRHPSRPTANGQRPTILCAPPPPSSSSSSARAIRDPTRITPGRRPPSSPGRSGSSSTPAAVRPCASPRRI